MTNVAHFERSAHFYNFDNYKKVKVLYEQSTSEYTFSFGLKTPICIQAKLSFVFKPNRILYSSQIESCIQAKLKVVIKPN